MAAHDIPYIATVSPSYPLELYDKFRFARDIRGTRYIHILVPCPPGWGYDPRHTVEMGEQAVKCGMFDLYEIIDGVFSFYGQSCVSPRANSANRSNPTFGPRRDLKASPRRLLTHCSHGSTKNGGTTKSRGIANSMNTKVKPYSDYKFLGIRSFPELLREAGRDYRLIEDESLETLFSIPGTFLKTGHDIVLLGAVNRDNEEVFFLEFGIMIAPQVDARAHLVFIYNDRPTPEALHRTAEDIESIVNSSLEQISMNQPPAGGPAGQTIN
jgi:hypothetical protein